MAPQQDEERGGALDERAPLLSAADPAQQLAVTHPAKAAAAPVPASGGHGHHGGIESKSVRRSLGGAYMLAMGMCGVVLVALGSTLEEIAENCGKVSTEVGSVFIARGLGAVLGAISSAKLYTRFRGNTIIIWVLLVLCSLLLWLPYITSVWVLHGVFLCLGLCTAITDTGCQIMTRRVHGSGAGPWLGANTVAFGLSGALVPCIAYITSELMVQYAIMSGLGVLASFAFILLPTPETAPGFITRKAPPPRAAGSGGGLRAFLFTYRLEFVMGFMVFWLIGGKVGATAYLTQYVTDTGIIAESQTSALIAVLWLAISVGRLTGIHLQRTITLHRLYFQSMMLFLGGAVGAALPLLLPSSPVALWVGVALYGVLNGPTVGYCYDINNRITAPSETGMSIVMFGLNCGSSFIPFGISGMWDVLRWPSVLFAFITVSHLLPFPAMLTVRALHSKTLKGAA